VIPVKHVDRFVPCGQRHRSPRGFSIIDLLIVITIIGVLLSLLFPAVNASREGARLTVCQNNLKQLAYACSVHESTAKHFPTGGWYSFWVGTPERGGGYSQPGGWIYNILPYMDQTNLYEIQKQPKDEADLAAMATTMIQTPLPVLNCPTRRSAKAYMTATTLLGVSSGNGDGTGRYFTSLGMSNTITLAARTDYAGNGGRRFSRIGWAHTGLIDGDDVHGADRAQYMTVFTSTAAMDAIIESGRWWKEIEAVRRDYTDGIFYPGSTTTAADITDGMSKTYLCGEKYMDPECYSTGTDPGDYECPYVGDCNTIVRWAGEQPEQGFDRVPQQDQRGVQYPYAFGSAHPGGFNMAFCDGSVHTIRYDIHYLVHQHLASRSKDAGGERRDADDNGTIDWDSIMAR
jgi:prepilin-type processing-associated H-X9-DG protein